MAKKTVATKKRNVKVDAVGQAHIHSSFNNIIVSLANGEGQIISWSSAGKMGFRGSKKNTPYAAQMAAQDLVWYCAHTLHLGRDRSLTCSRQAVGLILTKIVGGRPVTNITFTCKRMLRTYKDRGDFWHYEKCPEVVKMMVNRIDMSALEELYKVTKDRRI